MDKFPPETRSQRIAIIGNGGTGKTTLAIRVGKALNLPVFHMDLIIYGPNWTRTPDDEVRQRIEEIVAKPVWIFDGMGPLWSAEFRMQSADLVIFLDPPFAQCMEWAMKRQRDDGTTQQPDRSEGCLFEGQDERMAAALTRVETEFIPTLRQLVTRPEIAGKTIHLRDRDQLEDLYTEVVRRAANTSE